MAQESTLIAIIGAGLAGLSAAYTLERLGYSPVIFEASDKVGGRVKTDAVNGFLLDHGFHVILSSFHEIFSLIPKQELELGFFPSGIMIKHHGEWISLLNPIRDPEKLVFGKERFFFDFLKLSKLYLAQKMQSEKRMAPDPQPPSTWEMLKKMGISAEFLEVALKPLLGGIFFDPNLFTSSAVFKHIFPFFIEGKPGLPKKGISALPLCLANKLTCTQIRLQQKVEKIEKQSLTLASGEVFSADYILIATDLRSAEHFIPLLSQRQTRPAACLYFTINDGFIEPSPFPYVDGNQEQPINNFCFPNLVQHSYAPEGKLLCSISVIHSKWQKEAKLEKLIKEQLAAYFNIPAEKWEHLKTFHIEHALPDQSRPPFFHGKYCFDRAKNIYLCGECVDTASFHDTIASGRKAAEALHQDRQ